MATLHEFPGLVFSDPAEERREYLFSNPNRETIWGPKSAETGNPLPHTMVEHSDERLALRNTLQQKPFPHNGSPYCGVFARNRGLR
jgi:hypothetical protein